MKHHTIKILLISVGCLSIALGDGGMITRGEQHEAKLYDGLTKAGEFVAADGTVKQAGIDENADTSNFKI